MKLWPAGGPTNSVAINRFSGMAEQDGYAYLLVRPHAHARLPDVEDHLRARLRGAVEACASLDPGDPDVIRRVEEEYAEHRGRPFYGDLVRSMTAEFAGTPTRLTVLRVSVPAGPEAPWEAVRAACGATDPAAAAPGTVRAALAEPGRPLRYNVVHSPDSAAAAAAFERRWVPTGPAPG